MVNSRSFLGGETALRDLGERGTGLHGAFGKKFNLVMWSLVVWYSVTGNPVV